MHGRRVRSSETSEAVLQLTGKVGKRKGGGLVRLYELERKGGNYLVGILQSVQGQRGNRLVAL